MEDLDRTITIAEVEAAIHRLKLKKAPGEDGVPAEFFKSAPDNFIERLTYLFNEMFVTGNVSTSFQKAIIFPIYKQGDAGNPANYRGISFLNVVSKIFTCIIYTRLEKWVERNSLLSECQAGFRKGYSTIDNIFCLTSVAKSYLARGKKLYALFVDFKSAFDTVERNALFYKLSNLGMSRKMLNIIQSLYRNNEAQVWDGKNFSESFETEIGVKQGCLLSPLLFALYLNDLVAALPGGITFNNAEIKTLMYADDIVILAETSYALQRMINKLQDYCVSWGLTVNISKTKVMIFRKSSGRYAREEKWFLNGQELEKVRQYKYLGMQLTHNLQFRTHLAQKLNKSKIAINTTWKSFLCRKDVPHSAKFKLFEAAVRSIMGYGAEVWGVYGWEEVEKLLWYFLKKLFHLPKNSPKYMLHIETGLSSLCLSTLQSHFRYVNRVMSMSDQRLPKIIASYLLETKSQFFEQWERLSVNVNEALSLENLDSWKSWQAGVILKLEVTEREGFITQAQQSEVRRSYPYLNHNLCERNYFRDEFPIQFISIIFKTRGELLKLNYLPHIQTTSSICPLCNLKCEENVLHFVGQCPILKEIRNAFLGKQYLANDETSAFLNGRDWKSLVNYVKTALDYRNKILTESF